LQTVEPQKNGRVHIHFFLLGCKPSDFVDDYRVKELKNTPAYMKDHPNAEEVQFVGVSDTLDRLWSSYGFGSVNSFEAKKLDEGRVRLVAGYMLKYITKQLADVDFAAALWKTGIRSFSASRWVTSLMKGTGKLVFKPIRFWVVLEVAWLFLAHYGFDSFAILEGVKDSLRKSGYFWVRAWRFLGAMSAELLESLSNVDVVEILLAKAEVSGRDKSLHGFGSKWGT